MASESIAVSAFGLMGYWLIARAQGILFLNISANQPASHDRHEQNMVACLHIVHSHLGVMHWVLSVKTQILSSLSLLP